MSRALKENDFVEFSKLYEAEFNQPDIHDRILVFDVVGSPSWLRSQTKSNIEENERSESEASAHSNDEQIKTETNDNEADQTEDKETEESTSDSVEMEARSNDCKIGEQNQTGESEASDEIRTDDATTANKTAVATEADNESALNETIVENVEITRSTRYEDDSKCLQDTEIVADTNNANLNNKEQIEDDSENYGSHNPINEDEIIRQHKFYIHSSWLAVQSTYFRSMFFSGMKESNAREVHVQILVCEEKSHLMLLEAMYKIDSLNKASVDELLEVLRLAHKYDVKFVFKKCKYCLQVAVDSLKICEQIMRFIKIDNDITDVEDLASTLQSFLAKEFSPLDKTWQTTSFEELCEPSLRYLLSSDKLVATSENTVFHALIHWIEQRGLDNVSNDKRLPSLLSVVRFELMPIDYLYNTVQHNPVAKKLVDFNEHYLRGISYHALTKEMRQGLPCQLVKRTLHSTSEQNLTIPEPYISYTWVIPKDKLDKLVGTEERLRSDEFWFSGYKMMLTINQVKKYQKKVGMFSATVFLEIVSDLTLQSVVRVSWRPASQSFNSGNVATNHTFKTNARTSPVHVVYTIKSENPNTSTFGGLLATPAFGSQPFAFSFTSANTTESSKANSSQKENPTTPCLIINAIINLL